MKRSFLSGLGLALLITVGMRLPVAAQLPSILFGSNSGTAVPVAVSSAGAVSVTATTSSGAVINGTLTTSTTQACTIADTNETDLWTYTMPANTLNANGRGLRVTAFGNYGATANNKTIRLYFGGTIISDSGAVTQNATNWRFDAIILRTAASAQRNSILRVAGAYATGTGNSMNTAAIDTTGTIIIKVTGLNGTAAANDVCFNGATVETIK